MGDAMGDQKDDFAEDETLSVIHLPESKEHRTNERTKQLTGSYLGNRENSLLDTLAGHCDYYDDGRQLPLAGDRAERTTHLLMTQILAAVIVLLLLSLFR